jgi:hypothetical protein
MAQQHINIGTPNQQDGDFVRDAFSKTEANFTELYNVATNNVQATAEWISGLDFAATAANFPVNGSWYTATSTTVTLAAADATFDRIDVVVANAAGTISVLTGVISGATPSEPTPDFTTQYPIKFILVQASQTTPGGFANILVFDENLGQPSEWDFTAQTGYAANQLVAVTSVDPKEGTLSIEGTLTVQAGASFSADTGVSRQSINLLSFWVKLKSSYGIKGKILITAGSASEQTNHNVANGTYGFDATSLFWQKINIPLSTGIFVSTTDIDTITISPSNGGPTAGFFLDVVKLQVSTDVDPVNQPSTTFDTGATQILSNGALSRKNRVSANYAALGKQATDFSLSSQNTGLNGAAGMYATISGGENNRVEGLYSFVGGGKENLITEPISTVKNYNVVVGGYGNSIIESLFSSIVGGKDNTAGGGEGKVVGGIGNTVLASGGTFFGTYATKDSDVVFAIGDGVDDANRSSLLELYTTGALKLKPVASDPANGVAGMIYYNSTSNKIRFHNGTGWVQLATVA